MRIVGQIPHPSLLINVFKSGNKYILKFEAGPFEQSYKFLEADHLNSFEDIQKLINDKLLTDVFSIFDKMNLRYQETINSLP